MGNGEAGLGEQHGEIQKFILDMVGLNISWRCQGGISNLQKKQEPEFQGGSESIKKALIGGSTVQMPGQGWGEEESMSTGERAVRTLKAEVTQSLATGNMRRVGPGNRSRA